MSAGAGAGALDVERSVGLAARTRSRKAPPARAFVLVLAGWVLAGCGGAADRGDRFDEDVPLGRTLVQVVAMGANLEEAGFRDVRGYGTDSRGRIWVAEYGGLLHTFEADGRLLTTWDRRGQGPGEFGNPLALDTDPLTGRIVVREGTHMKILTEDLEETARWIVPRVPGGGVLPGVFFETGGSGVLFSMGLRRDSIMQDTLRLVWTPGLLLRADERGERVDTLASLVGGWSMLPPGTSARSTPPTAGRAIWLPVGTAGVLVGDGHQSYALHLLSTQGDTLRSFHRTLPREVLTDVEGPEFARGFVQAAAFDPHRSEILACRTQPQGGGGYFDPVQVDHFSLDGTYLGTLEWPGCPRKVSPEGTVFLETRGPLNVPVVLGFRYETEPGEQ